MRAHRRIVAHFVLELPVAVAEDGAGEADDIAQRVDDGVGTADNLADLP